MSFKIGQIVNGFTITEIQKNKVFGVKGTLPKQVIDGLVDHFENNPQEFFFRPGCDITKLVTS